MKIRLLVLSIIFCFASFAFGQSLSSSASIDKSCNAVAGKITIDKNKTAALFKISQIASGNNCYSGASFAEKGFVIKNSSGNIIFQYQKDAKGNLSQPYGSIEKLQLSSGIYYVYVDGGRGAYLKLDYVLK